MPDIFSYFRRRAAAAPGVSFADHDAIDLASIGGTISTVYLDIACVAPPETARSKAPPPSAPPSETARSKSPPAPIPAPGPAQPPRQPPPPPPQEERQPAPPTGQGIGQRIGQGTRPSDRSRQWPASDRAVATPFRWQWRGATRTQGAAFSARRGQELCRTQGGQGRQPLCAQRRSGRPARAQWRWQNDRVLHDHRPDQGRRRAD